MLLVCHFQYWNEIFFKVTVIDGSLGKVEHHAIRIAFQVRESPNACSFLCIIDATVLSNNNADEYIKFIDGFAKEFVQDVSKKSEEFFHFVTSHVINKKNENCYHHF